MISVEYLAGFADGEGYLGLARIPRRNGSPEYCLRVSLYNNNRAILDEIQQTVGGTMSVLGQRQPGWKPSYALIWTNAAAARLIRMMEPFLIVKARQGSTLLSFDQRIRAGRRSRDRNGRLLPLTGWEVRIRDGFYRTLKRLNRRGPLGQSRRPAQNPSKKQSRISAEYVAGFVDGEGSLMITKAKPADCRTPQYHPRISVANTERGVLEAIQHTYGGIITDQPARKPAWKDAYHLVWTDGMIEPLLSSVAAHLRVKSKQAHILDDFICHRKATKQGRRGPAFLPLPPKVVAFRESLRKEIKELNRRGSPRLAPQ